MVTIETVTGLRDLMTVDDYVVTEYGRLGYLTELPQTLPDVYFAAIQGDKLVGAVGVVMEYKNMMTPRVFGFSPKRYWRHPLNRYAEVCRFFATGGPLVTQMLIVALHHTLKKKHKRIALATMKPGLHRYLTGRLGVPSRVLCKQMNLDEIPEEFEPWYLQSPHPVAVAFHSRRMLTFVRDFEEQHVVRELMFVDPLKVDELTITAA